MERFEPFWIKGVRWGGIRVISDEISLPSCYQKMLAAEALRVVTHKALDGQKIAVAQPFLRSPVYVEEVETWEQAFGKSYDLAIADKAELPLLKEKQVADAYIALQPTPIGQCNAYIDENVCVTETDRLALRTEAFIELLIRLQENEGNRMHWQEYKVSPKFEEVVFDSLPKGIHAGNLCTTVNGHRRKTFCFYGLPNVREGEKCPAVVLVHGAGGNAFYHWVQEWMKRGYAAISIDINCTKFENNDLENRVPNFDAGELHIAGFDHVQKDPKDSWVYYAVSQIISAHSFMREISCVNRGKIGLVGISWGGVMSLIALGADERFALGGIIYSAGFITEDLLGEETHIFENYAKKRFYDSFYDARNYAGNIRVPVIMNAGLEDGAFSPFARQRTCRLIKGGLELSIQKELYHDNESNFVNENVIAFFDDYCFGKKRRAKLIVSQERNSVTFSCEQEIEKAALCYVEEDYVPHVTPWQEIFARTHGKCGVADIPKTAAAYMVVVYYGDGLYTSSKIYGREQV